MGNEELEQEIEQEVDSFVGICSRKDRKVEIYSLALEIDRGNAPSKILRAAAELRMVLLDQCNASQGQQINTASRSAGMGEEGHSQLLSVFATARLFLVRSQ